jgi:hypothetical protein
MTQKLKLKPAALILEFGTAKPSCAVPMGRTAKMSVNIPTGAKELVKISRGWDGPVRARTSNTSSSSRIITR